MIGVVRKHRHRKIGLALGSGSARGWAHIGVINALVEAGVDVDYVAGTSIGALVGVACASGKIRSLEKFVRGLDWKKVISHFDVVFPRSGLFDGRKISESIREHVEPGDIEDLSVPFCAVSTDLATGNEVHIRQGDVIEAVRASISIPGMFTPVKRGEMLLVDGGLRNPVPTGVVRGMGADYVIAVDLNYDIAGIRRSAEEPLQLVTENAPPGAGPRTGSAGGGASLAKIGRKVMSVDVPGLAQARQWLARESVPNIFEVLMSSINIMEVQITEMRLAAEPADLLLRPRLGHLGFMDFHRADETIAEGYRVATDALEESKDAHRLI
jgi:NTE family protein